MDITLTIDGNQITVPKGTTVYQAAKKLGINVPIFCYQDRMPPFGACRVCLVEVEKMGKPQTSCTLEATEGMVVKTISQMAIQGRNEILEFLLINHPLDCPICDRGGECPLQEHAFSHGPGESRFFEEKRHFVKPYPLGPVLMLDRERCIVCARCTRFGDLIAGDHALEFIERGYKTEVGTPHGGPAESKFIGNTIMICPVGALTSQVYRFRARPWDNDATESTCTLCPVGCSLYLDSRDGEIMRTRSRENPDVNDIWLCDKGWFGYEFSSNPERLTQPLIRRGSKLEPASWDEALDLIVQKVKAYKSNGKLAAFGGNPLTLEENYLFQQLMRKCLEVNHIDHRIGMPIFSLDEEGMAPGMQMSIGECEKGVLVLLGCDITEEFPVIWLRMKKGEQVYYFGHYGIEISNDLYKCVFHAPGQEIDIIREHLPQILKSGKKVSLFIGSQYLSSLNRKVILAEILKFTNSINLLEGRGNSMGARFAGMRPDLGPFGEKIDKPGMNAIQVLESESWDLLYVAGANPALKFPAQLWSKARSKLNFLIVQDLFLTETAKQADVVLPTLSFVEKGGTFMNIEYRMQKLLPGKMIPENLYSDGEIFNLLASKLNESLKIELDFSKAHQQAIPSYLDANEMISKEGLKATFAHSLFDEGVRMKHDPHVFQLVKEPFVKMNPKDAINKNLSNGDTVNISSESESIQAKIKFDRLVAEGTVVLPLGFENVPVQNLAKNLLNGLPVDVKKLPPLRGS